MNIRVDLGDFRRMTEEIKNQVVQEVDDAVEKRALKMVNDSRSDAPRLSGKLAESIDIIDQDTKPMQRTYGTNVEYAQRQEYEHATKSGYIRNNVTKHDPLLRQDIKDAVDRVRGGA